MSLAILVVLYPSQSALSPQLSVANPIIKQRQTTYLVSIDLHPSGQKQTLLNVPRSEKTDSRHSSSSSSLRDDIPELECDDDILELEEVYHGTLEGHCDVTVETRIRALEQ